MIREAKIVFLGALVGLALSLLSSVSGVPPSSPPDLSNEQGACGPHSIRQEPMYMDLPRKHAGMITPEHFNMPGYRVRINEKGLRDEPFNATKPANTTRILVIGDSFTYGNGVNESQRYTEKLENRLNDRYQKTFQVINAGRPGAGMRDYYQYLYNKGIRYDPDIVVVAFSTLSLDSISRQWHDQVISQILDEMQPDSMKETSPSQWREIRRRFSNRLNPYFHNMSWDESPIRIYGNLMQRLAETEDFRLFLFHFQEPSPQQGLGQQPMQTLKRWDGQCSVTILLPPKELENGVPDRYSLPDRHLNSAGHSILAEKLSRDLGPVIDPPA